MINTDILYHILRTLYQDSQTPSWLSPPTPSADLLSCALVSSEWLDATLPFLYLSIDLSSLNHQALFSQLNLRPHLCPFVKHLTFPFHLAPELEKNQDLFPNAQLSFTYDFDNDGSVVEGAERDGLEVFTRWRRKVQLRKLDLVLWEGSSWEPVARVLLRANELFDLSTLVSLEFSELPIGQSIDDLRDDPASSALFEPLRLLLLQVSRTLYQLMITTLSPGLAALFLDSLPNLTHLTLPSDLANAVFHQATHRSVRHLHITTDPSIEPSPIQEHPKLLFAQGGGGTWKRAFPALKELAVSPFMGELDVYANAGGMEDDDVFVEMEENELVEMEKRREEMRALAREMKDQGVELVDQFGAAWLDKEGWAEELKEALPSIHQE